MSIQNELNKIKNAVYGKEVRVAIHDGIKKTYDDASKNGNANMEVSLARGTYLNLSQRLTSTDQDISTKANAKDFSALKEKIGSLGSSATFKGADTLANILLKPDMKIGDEWYDTTNKQSVRWNGTAFIPVGSLKLGENSVTDTKISDNSINKGHVDFLDNYYVNATKKGYTTGVVLGSGSATPTFDTRTTGRTLIVPVEPHKTYRITKTLSDRFRIVADSTLKTAQGDLLNRFIKDEFHTGKNESTETTFTLTTRSEDKFLYIYVSNDDKEPIMTVEEVKELTFSDNVQSKNISKGKNEFNGNYVRGGIYGDYNQTPSSQTFEIVSSNNGKSAIHKVDKNTDYSISCTESERFRVALAKEYPTDKSLVKIMTPLGASLQKPPLSINTGDYSYIIVTVSNDGSGLIPDLLQIEKSSSPTQMETYGYKFSPEAKPYGVSEGGEKDGKVYVEDFRTSSKTDSQVVQKAFDFANGQVVSFASGRTYNLNSQVIANASKVMGIEGNNALLIKKGMDGNPALVYKGNKTGGSAMPNDPINAPLFKTEMSAYIENLRVTSEAPFINDGIVIKDMSKPRVHAVFVFKTKNALKFRGYNRDVIISDIQVYDNGENGVFFDNTNIHQLNFEGGHISYNKNGIKFVDSNIANVNFNGTSIENADKGNGYIESESLVTLEETVNGNSIYEVINFTGCNLQEHGDNTKPLINADVTNGQIYDLNITGGIIGNCSANSVPIKVKKAQRVCVNGVGFPSNQGISTLELEGVVSGVRVVGSSFNKPIKYSGATVGSLIISSNITGGVYATDVKNGNLVIIGNL